MAADDERLTGEDVTWPGADGEMKGYLVRPADQDGKLPTVIVIHENRGLNAHIRDVARRMALEGFVALAPDFLSPLGGTPADEDKAREMFGELDAAQTAANGVATVALPQRARARQRQGRRGRLLLGRRHGQRRSRSHAPDLDAGVAYYGAAGRMPPTCRRSRRRCCCTMPGSTSASMPASTPTRRRSRPNGKDFTIHIYDGVQHAFNNDTSAARYDKAAAELAWERTVAFFKEHLG